MSEEESKKVEDALIGLINIEEELEVVERKAEIARLKSVQEIYKKRSPFTKALDKFWHIVLSQHPEFAEFVRSQDFKYIELIEDIYISWNAATSDEDSDTDPSEFTITFQFSALDEDFPAQTVSKSFSIEKIDPETIIAQKKKSRNLEDDEDEEKDDETERLVSEPATIIWPKSYDSINPSKVADKKSKEGKKNYRAGMKSFFGWFKWTGKKPGKEFPSGDDFARLFSTDIFPNAVKYYTEAQRDGLEEELDSDASEPLDLSDNETDSRGSKRKREEEDN